MSLELKVRGKTYKVEVDYKGTFTAHLGQDDGGKAVTADTLRGLEQKMMTATRTSTSKVAIKLKRLGRRPLQGTYGKAMGYYDRDDEQLPWEVIVVTVRGVNEHTGHLMVTWPDGTKSDDIKAGRYNRNKDTYFPLDSDDAEILSRRNQIDEATRWIESHTVDATELAKAAVAEALGE